MGFLFCCDLEWIRFVASTKLRFDNSLKQKK